MNKNDMFIRRLLTVPNDFTIKELRRVLKNLGYYDYCAKNIAYLLSFDRLFFLNNHHIISISLSDGDNLIKKYQLRPIVQELKFLKLL